MKIIALTPCRNEDWILGLSMRAALMWVDEVIALNHASTDRTGDILREIQDEHPGRVTILEAGAETWTEMAHRQWLLEVGRKRGGTHFAILDADEILTGNLVRAIGNYFSRLRSGGCIQVNMPCMWGNPTHYRHDQSIWSRAVVTIGFCDSPALSWHAGRNGYDYHHREPYGSQVGVRRTDPGGLMHLQFVYNRRLRAKQALYKMQEVTRWPGRVPVREVDRMYSLAVDERGLGVKEAPEGWWKPYQHLMPHLDLEHEPWQEVECKRLWQQYGAQHFAGLDLFGVVQ